MIINHPDQVQGEPAYYDIVLMKEASVKTDKHLNSSLNINEHLHQEAFPEAFTRRIIFLIHREKFVSHSLKTTFAPPGVIIALHE